MEKLNVFMVLQSILLLLIVTVKCYTYRTCNLGNSFDILILSQTWIFTRCMENKTYVQGCPHLKPHGDWLIHGLWPQKLNSSSCPADCSNSISFRPEDMIHLEEELSKKWTDLNDLVQNRTTHCFWRHEWEKHGRCGVEIDEINMQTKYFQKTLELFDKYNMTTILKKAKIFPGVYSNVEVIFNGLNRVLGKRPMISCKIYKYKGQKAAYLNEIRLCLDKSLNLINCDRLSDFLSDCKNYTMIYRKDMPDISQTLSKPKKPYKKCK